MRYYKLQETSFLIVRNIMFSDNEIVFPRRILINKTHGLSWIILRARLIQQLMRNDTIWLQHPVQVHVACSLSRR